MYTPLLDNSQLPQADSDRPTRETLPTMYDLPSEDPEEPGLPDEFHLYQPQLLQETFVPSNYPPERVFTAIDMNLYYDVQHVNRYKRPDWFAVVGVSRFYEERDLRLSYVIWQEDIAPLIVVELLSPGTEKEDLGYSIRNTKLPPGKWEVYERYLKVPYYMVFSRYTDEWRVFLLEGSRYKELKLSENRLWLPEVELGLGMWMGKYKNIKRFWLRWYDKEGEWIPTSAEQVTALAEKSSNLIKQTDLLTKQAETLTKQAETLTEQAETSADQAEKAKQRAELAEKRVEELTARLRELGIEP